MRQREKTRLASLFTRVFIDEANRYDLHNKLQLVDQKVELELISDYETESIDTLINNEITGATTIETTNSTDLQRLFDYFIKNNLSPYYPEDRSIGRMKESIYKYFKEELDMDYKSDLNNIINVILSTNNITHFKNVIDLAKEKYKEETEKREAILQKKLEWEVPEVINYSSNCSEYPSTKSILKPLFINTNWKPEEKFRELLDSSTKVSWWFKNGDRDATYFAVPYIENGNESPFYVDFIVYFEDGTIGLFDTKSGRTIADAKSKCEGLQKYIEENNTNSKKLVGGIVTNTDPERFSGRWVVYKGNGGDLIPNKYDNWETLEL